MDKEQIRIIKPAAICGLLGGAALGGFAKGDFSWPTIGCAAGSIVSFGWTVVLIAHSYGRAAND